MNKNKYMIINFTVIALIVIVWGLAAPWRTSGDCMEPAVKDRQLVFLNRIAPYLRQYKINDIILFNHENRIWISRIVALENDTIQITENNITVNNAPLQNPTKRNWTDWKYGTYGINEPIKVPSGHVYVLSDNLSAHHDDSRIFGPIAKKSIIGLVW